MPKVPLDSHLHIDLASRYAIYLSIHLSTFDRTVSYLQVISDVADFTPGNFFKALIDERQPQTIKDADKIQRVLLCSGKVPVCCSLCCSLCCSVCCSPHYSVCYSVCCSVCCSVRFV